MTLSRLGAALVPLVSILAGACAVLAAAASTPPPATLNLSQDLVTLGVAATNMVPNQPSLDAGPLFMAGVEYAKAKGISTVVADPGSYYFSSIWNVPGSNTHVAVSGIDNMTIDLHGADLIFTHPMFYGVIVYASTNAVLQNFTVDYQPLPFTQLRVVSVDVPNLRIQYSVEPGYQDPVTFNSFPLPPGVVTPEIQVHVFRNGRPILPRLFTQLPFGGSRFSLVFPSSAETLAAVRPGDVVAVSPHSPNDAVGLNHCTGCTLRKITVFSCACGEAVQSISVQSTVMERIYAIPKPGTDRLISTPSAVAVGVSGPNNQIRLSRSVRNTDDAFWFWGRVVGTVQAQSDSRTFTVAANTAWTWKGLGDNVANGVPVGFENPSTGATLGSAVIVSQGTPASSFPYETTYTFDRDLPGSLVGSVMSTNDPALNGANSVIERSASHNSSCCRGIYLAGLSSATVRGNYIDRASWAGVTLVHSMAPGDPPTAPPNGVTVTNNVIDGTVLKSDWWWFEMAAIQSVTLTTAYDLMPGSPFSNLTVTNNFIADSGRSAIWLGNTNGGNISGNYLLQPNQRPDTANAYTGRPGDELRPLVVDTTSTGIGVSNNTIDTTSGKLFVTDAQFNELAAYAPGATARLSAFNIGSLAAPTATLTDADGVVRSATIQSTTVHALDVQVPAGAALGGAYFTLTSGGAKYFGTLFVDSQDNVPTVNGCVYDVMPASLSVPATTTTLSVLVVTAAGCAYQATDADTFVTGASGNGTAVIGVSIAANTGAARTTTIEIAGQPFTLTQAAMPVASDLSIESPANGATVAMPITVSGWAINRGVSSGTGVDAVHIYLTPAGGVATFLGAATYGTARPDIGAIYGSQFTNSGYTFTGGSGFANGSYTLTAFAHNALTGTFDTARSVTITIGTPVGNPQIGVDTPTANQIVTSSFEIGGWLLDANASSGTGVDDVKIYVQLPGAPAPGVFIGHGRLGLSRPDVGALFGSQFNSAGFHFTITGLSPGPATLWVIGHSTVTSSDSISKAVPYTVSATGLMSVDVPTSESIITANTFSVGGWAIDRSVEGTAQAGTGIDSVVVYAFHNPGSGEPAVFLGEASYGIARSDVAAFYGSRYTNSGYGFIVDRAAAGLGTGEYNIVPIAHNTITNTYSNLAIVRVVLQ